jgi:hypothetical protein
MLVYFPTGIRVVVCTANYIECDWLFKTQGIWYQDFPLKTSTTPTTTTTTATPPLSSTVTPTTTPSSSSKEKKGIASTSTTAAGVGSRGTCEFEDDLVDYLLRYQSLDTSTIRQYDFSDAKVRTSPLPTQRNSYMI